MRPITKIRAKKGNDYLMSIILSLLVGVLLLSLGYTIYSNMKSLSDRETCRLSVIAKSNTKSPIFAGESTIVKSLKCKTQIVQIKVDGVYKNGKKITDLSMKDIDKPENLKIVQDKAERAIADEMYDCWYEFQGQDPFGQYNANRRCVPCASISFSEEFQKKVNTLPDFMTHLTEFRDEKGVDYMTYLSNGQVKGDYIDGDFPTNNSYSVVFITSKDNNLWKAVSLGLVGAADTTAGRKAVAFVGEKGIAPLAEKLASGATSGLVKAAPKIIKGGLRIGGSAPALILTAGFLVYDLANEEKPNIYGVQVMPTSDTVTCQQFY